MARIPEPTVQQLEKRRVTAEAKRTITELMNRINDSNLTENERLEAGQNLDRLVELQAPGVEEALKQINNEETAKTLLYFTPGIGQAMAAGELVLNPTWENAGWAALSIVPFARGGARAAKSLGVIKGAKKFGDDITWEIKNALETAQDYIRKPAPKTRVGPVAGAKGEQFKEAGKRRLRQTAETPSPVTATKPKPKTEPPLETTTSPRRSMTPEEFMGGTVPETPLRPRRSVPGGRPYDQADKRNFRTSLAALGAGAVGYGAQDALNLTASDLAETSPELVRRQEYVPPPGGEEAETDVEQRPELPMTGVPGEQPEAIPDMTPTDQDIEGLFNGQGMPEKFQDDPSKDAVSAAFLRERAKAFGDARGQIEGAPGLYEEPEGVDFINTPEGQALLQNRMTPMSPEEQAPPGGIDPLTPTPRTPASPTPETPGMTPRVPPQMPLPGTGPTPSPDQRIQDLPRLMPELDRQMRPQGPTPESPEDSTFKEDVLDDLATMRPQDAGPPTDDDIVSLFEGRNVPPSQMSREEIKNMLIEAQIKLEEQPNLDLTEEDERKFAELLSLLRR